MKTLFLCLALMTAPTTFADAYSLVDSYYARFESLDGEPVDQEALDTFLTEVETELATQPDSLEYRTTAAVVRAAWAKDRGIRGLGALKKAREELEEVVSKDPKAMQGYAIAILARLYATVPRWPIAFGDTDRARELYEMSVDLLPDSLVVIYYSGLFHLEQGDSARGESMLQRMPELKLDCYCTDWDAYLRESASKEITAARSSN